MAPAGKSGGLGAAGCAAAEGSPEAFAAWAEELLGLEVRAEEEETTSLLMSCSHTELQARGIAVLKLCVAEQTTALYGRACLVLERPGGLPMPSHRITNGDIVGVFDQASRPLSKAVPLASAVVQRVRPNGIALAFDTEIPPEVLDGRQLNLAAVSSDVTMRRYREALDVLKSGRVDGPAAGLVEVCFGGDAAVRPRFREPKSNECGRADAVDCAFRAEQSHNLNEPQKAAVVKALCAADIAIVHGPPGTGKTTTLVAYILEAVYRKQRLLVTAPSNVAVDNLLERVVACGCRSVVRLGHPARVQTEMHKYTMDNVVYMSDQAALCRDIKKEIEEALKKSSSKKKDEARASRSELTNLRKELRQRERRAVAEVLRHTQVVFATCAGAATLHREIRRGGGSGAGEPLEFDVVVIDEAAQALEVACWIPLLLGKKAVLAGDHQQLAACVKSTEAQRRGLDRTLFARAIERYGDHVAALLSIQYRMNETIMGWSSRSFYASRLEAAECVASRTIELREDPAENLVGEVLTTMASPLLFVDTGGLAMYREDGEDATEEANANARGGGANAAVHQSRSNHGESRFLVHYAKCLVRCGIAPRDITVITPYNRQVERLRMDFGEDADCQKLGLEKPRVNTVDSFQGQEADCVLISLVRSNERGTVGFLADYRRLNVAVTRGRKHVMLVGDAATISSDKMLASLYDYACECGRVAFVEQLLNDEGIVPPDPSVAKAPPSRRLERNLGAARAAGERKEKDEEEVRQRMEVEFKAILESKGGKEFPPNLNSFERAIAHELAASLGLFHESQGEGMKRRLRVWAPGFSFPPEVDVPGGQPTAEKAKEEPAAPPKAKQATAKAQRAAPDVADAASDASEGDVDGETALQAFERRAAATLASLNASQPAAEWKAPTDEELEILQRAARAAEERDGRPFRLEQVGSGKKRRCRIEREAAEGETVPEAAPSASASSSAPASSDAAAKPASATNSFLAQVHAEKQRRQVAEAAERRELNEAAKSEMKQAKKVGKTKQQGIAAAAAAAAGGDDEDLDAVLLEFSAQDGICAFGTCQAKTHTLIDPVSLCKLCRKRFCLTHFQAEMHGCGEAAQKAAQKQFKQANEVPRGSGLTNRPAANRDALANKLQGKISGAAASRTAKKKDGK